MPNASSIQKQLSEKLGVAWKILEECQQLVKSSGSENGSSPTLRKKGGLTTEQKVQFKLKREKRLSK